MANLVNLEGRDYTGMTLRSISWKHLPCLSLNKTSLLFWRGGKIGLETQLL